ncbi:DUF2239 family protein [Microbulbifer sp.]|uniref:DUF2239 family protein n=1 Tax=Microbulbifer sp. TaxID=1908541 RepID=UPI003F39A863
MNETIETDVTAFLEERRIASGGLTAVAAEVVDSVAGEQLSDVLIFDNTDSRIIEVDFRGSREEVLRRLKPPKPEGLGDGQTPRRKRGRPKLGVVAREVTLLPRHWEWLASQPGGASVVLRRLVEQARLKNSHKDRTRRAQESCYHFMSAMAGNLPHFEEAARALFAGERDIYHREIASWPEDIRAHSARLAQAAFVNTRAAGRLGEEE